MSSRLNLMAPEVRNNPYPFYAELRRNTPVCQVDPGGFWAISRYEDILGVLKNSKSFSSAALRPLFRPQWLSHNPVEDSLLVQDPPVHARLRNLIQRAFTPTSLNRLEPLLRKTSEQLVQDMMPRRSVDIVTDFSLPIPATAICTLLGLDISRRMQFKRWGDVLATASSLPPGDLAGHEEVRTTVRDMEAYLRGVIEQRRRDLSDDLISTLLQGRVDGEALTDEELMSFLFLLLPAGTETTAHLLSFSALLLAERPELLEQLRAQPELIPSFVEEVLRFEPPTHGLFRMTIEEVEVGGVRLPANAMVLLLVGAGNRDEGIFQEAEQFMLGRTGPQGLALGYGIHYCIGAALARLETRVALEALLPRIRHIKRTSESVQWNASFLVRGPTTLPVELVPA
ncbi:cytochrome P450 [Archangium gephyra]|nr:cytochrome P450 [Archangium gephyra]